MVKGLDPLLSNDYHTIVQVSDCFQYGMENDFIDMK
jgi:hypothetical protein